MDKAALFMDMPETCAECMFSRKLSGGITACCEIESEPLNERLCRVIDLKAGYFKKRQTWCPLKRFSGVKCDKCFNIFLHGYQCGWDDFKRQMLNDEMEE